MVYNMKLKVKKMKFYKSLLVISLFSVFTSAQELDESFLKSLPDDIASDLLKQTEKKDSLEEIQYRRPSTFIEKPEPTSDRFGSSVFSMMQSTLMPINEPNFDSSYILDYGDELELQLIGQKSSTSKLYVKRDGSVNIKDIGKVFLAGLSLGESVDLIKSKVNEYFIGIESYLTLTNVRDVQIIMAGNVFNPGPYTLSGNSNIFHALSVSGGPSETGSFRSIDLVRNNIIIESIDLYQTFIFGKSSFNTRLRSGDIVFVNPVNNVISVSGAVNRPGDYELFNDENLSKAIFFANGISKFSDLGNIKLERVLDGRIKPLAISNISQFDEIKSKDGDRIFIRDFAFRSVEIVGAVLNPGIYLMNEGDTIFDVIDKAGGYSKNAYPYGGIYENLNTRYINQRAKESLYESFLESILSEFQGQSEDELASIVQITTQLLDSPASGRVVSNFLDRDQALPTLVKEGDIITIPEFVNQVYIYGEVSSEGTAIFEKGKDVDYYLNKKGGLGQNADKNSIYILQPNGETERLTYNKNIFVNQSKKVEIYAGSIIFIPRQINNEYSQRLKTQAYASILSNLGVSLASISVLKD